MCLLILEDDMEIREFTARGLAEAVSQVEITGEVKTAVELFAEEVYDEPITIDLRQPDIDGLDLIGRCRAQGQASSVLSPSACRSVDEQGRGEQGGANLTKRFAVAELLARMQNLFRHSALTRTGAVRLRIADLKPDSVECEARRGEILETHYGRAEVLA